MKSLVVFSLKRHFALKERIRIFALVHTSQEKGAS